MSAVERERGGRWAVWRTGVVPLLGHGLGVLVVGAAQRVHVVQLAARLMRVVSSAGGIDVSAGSAWSGNLCAATVEIAREQRHSERIFTAMPA